MPPLKWSQPALRNVARLHDFLAPKSRGPHGQVFVRGVESRDAAKRAVKTIRQGVKLLGKYPEMGRPVDELPPEFREWVVEFGAGAYLALYHYDGKRPKLPSGIVTASVADFCRSNEVSICFQVDTSSTSV